MPDPAPDDDWAEFARELELDPRPHQTRDESPADEAPDGADESDAGDDLDDAAEGAEVGAEDGAPGTGRKRRRRRRRKKKNGAALIGDAPAAGPEDEPAETDAPEDATGPEGFAGGDEDGGPEPDDELAAAEDAGGAALRDLIANWNVPSWDEIVAGLHRPDR